MHHPTQASPAASADLYEAAIVVSIKPRMRKIKEGVGMLQEDAVGIVTYVQP
jgi:hypothetical protein